MALPTSGPLTWAMINDELGRSPTHSTKSHLNDSAVRALAERPSGTIAYSDLHGKSSILMQTTFTIAHTYSYVTRRRVYDGGGYYYQTTYGGDRYGYGKNQDGSTFGHIGNRSLVGRTIGALYNTTSTYGSGWTGSMFMVLGKTNTGSWWSSVTVGNTQTNRSGSGKIADNWWSGSGVYWANTSSGETGLSQRDVLGGRRSGTHALIFA